ncbi:hypothetical protein K8T06_06100, partial [bacterium]|nr:hypothetical protein [bacterium]
GGELAGSKSTCVYEWDGEIWAKYDNAFNPGWITRHKMAYLPSLEGVVLYGGSSNEKMWLYRDHIWTELTPTVTPGDRQSFGMAYDSIRDRLVLFGGIVDYEGAYAVYSVETWEFDGINWMQIETIFHPPQAGNMTFDSCRGVVVVFNSGSTPSDGTWEYDGNDWTKIRPATTPPIRRSGAGFCFDESRCRVIMHGGISNTEPGYDETWEWDGYDWYLMEPDSGNGPFSRHGDMVYDSIRRCSVLYGGMHKPYTIETFEYRHSNPDICPQMGVTLNLSETVFHSGDLFSCTVEICNNTGDLITDYPLLVLLDVYGNYYWGPSFTEDFDSFLTQHSTFPEGITEVEVLPEFIWPPDAGSADGIIFYAALLDPAIHNLIGHMDMLVFGWE